jgi:hypothetical protein
MILHRVFALTAIWLTTLTLQPAAIAATDVSRNVVVGSSSPIAVPTVSIQLTYDASLTPVNVQSIVYDLQVEFARRRDWKCLTPIADMKPLLTAHAGSRRAILDRLTSSAADYAATIRLTKQQSAFARPWVEAQAWVASADSMAYIVVTGAEWSPDDTLAQTRYLKLFVDRLIPLSRTNLCFCELVDVDVHRNDIGAVSSVETDIHVVGEGQTSVVDALVYGHWSVNGVAGTMEKNVTNEQGVATVRFTPGENDPNIGDAIFVVDSAECPDAMYDPQWPQREVDGALSILENARADLDEDNDYRSSMNRIRRFLAIREGDLVRYAALMNPAAAPNRRQQAELILRRARGEQGRQRVLETNIRLRRDNWALVNWFGYDILSARQTGEPKITQIAGPENGVASVSTDFGYGARLDFGLMLRRRVVSSVWVSGNAALSLGEMRIVALNDVDVDRADAVSFGAGIYLDHNIKRSLWLFVESGFRYTQRFIDLRQYLANGRLQYTRDGAVATGAPAYVVDFGEGRFDPGFMFALGCAVRMSDFSPTWGFTNIKTTVDRFGDNRRTWRVTWNFGWMFTR